MAPQSDDSITDERDILLPCGYGYRVVREPEDDVIRKVFFVDEIIQTSGIERVGRKECRIGSSGAYLPQWEYILRGLVEFVDRGGRDAVTGEDLAEGLAVCHFTLFGAVVVGDDAETYVVCGSFGLDLFVGLPAVAADGEQKCCECYCAEKMFHNVQN